jgi:hypothetical protein
MGGVHLDLLPHLLSVVCGILNTSYISTTADEKAYRYQHYELSDLAATTWGNYDPNGTYDVEDQCYYETRHGNYQIRCAATWKMDVPKDYISWNLKFNDGSRIKFETGLCPESAYEYMLVEYMNMEMDSASYEYNVHCDEMIQDTIRSMKTEDCTTLINRMATLEQDYTTVPGQIFACISLVGPECPQKNDKFGLKIRGCFNSRDEAASHAKRLQKEDATFDIYVVDMYKWLLIPPDRDHIEDVHYNDTKLEELMTAYRENQSQAAKMFEDRKRDMSAKPVDGSFIKPGDENSSSTASRTSPRFHTRRTCSSD